MQNLFPIRRRRLDLVLLYFLFANRLLQVPNLVLVCGMSGIKGGRCTLPIGRRPVLFRGGVLCRGAAGAAARGSLEVLQALL